MFNKKELLQSSAVIAIAVAGFAFSSAAFAQATSTPAAPAGVTTTEPAPAVATPTPPASSDTVIVTGSRIRKSEFTSSSPIQVIATETSQLRGNADTASMLQGSSLAAGSPQNDATISSAFVTDGGPGSQTLSLRGLGASRTLVLLNGRRAGPAGVRGAVSSFDLNVIPQGQIDRTEILKDGASSIYGSDAIAGVANIITRRNIQGGEVQVFTSRPFEQGGETFAAEGVYGKSFDRGSFSVSVDYFKQEELAYGDRDFLSCANQYTFDARTGARNDLVDPRTGEFACRSLLSGHVWLYEYASGGAAGPWAGGQPLNSPNGRVKFQYDGTGALGTLVPGTVIPTPPPGAVGLWPQAPANWFIVDYNTATQGVANANPPERLKSSLIPETERTTFFATGQFDLTSKVEAYGEVLLNRRETRTNDFRQFWTYLYTEDLGDPVASGWRGFATLSPTPITDHSKASQTVDYVRVVGGIKGEFNGRAGMGSIAWDLVVQGSRSDGDYTNDRILDDAVDSAQLRTASCVGTVTPISKKNCIDVNWLSPAFLNGNPTAAERAFLFDVETGNTVYEQVYAEGTISGELFKLPAGNLGGALGFHVRKDSLNDTPGPITLAKNTWGSSASGITKGDDTTKEVFGELSIPLLRGVALAEELNLSVSGRYTDVESYGDASTYKVGLDWQVTPDFKVRGTTGTSFRAPALFELFLSNQTSFVGQRSIDPCIGWKARFDSGTLPLRVANNCRTAGIPEDYAGAGASATVSAGGGIGLLEAETSVGSSIGFVWSPQNIDLNVAIDYVEIEVADQVAQLGAGNIVAGCYNSVNFPTDQLCTLFTRGQVTSAFLINTVKNNYLNVNNQINRGIDLTARYRKEFTFGDLTIQTQATWQLEDKITLFEGTTTDTNGNVGDPMFVGGVNFRFDRDDWTYFWNIDMTGKGSEFSNISDTNLAGTTRYKIATEFTSTHDISVRRRWDQWDLTVGLSNVFDERPPALTTVALGVFSTEGTSVLASQYDYLGRRAFLTVRRRFK